MYASTQKGELTMSEVITMKRNNSDENTTLAMLSEYPNAGVKKAGIKNPNVQVYTIKKKYNIVYKQKNNNIEILRVLNKYQNLFAIL